MIETGRVVEVRKNTVRILVARNAACGECGACQVGRDNLNLIITADNDLGAKKNDNVLIELNTENFLLASAIFYGIPLFALIAGIAIPYYALRHFGYSNNSVQLIASVSGLLLLAVSYILIKSKESDFRNMGRFKSKMIKIIE
ncbi:MAG: SoxR reducing system RseC family protein [Clostridiales bacterium]|nr:SoxR reducing system RseC family protein [Clostridiales bacterium]